MKIPISEYNVSLQHGGHLYVCDNDCDDGDIRISVVVAGCSFNVDLSVDELQWFRQALKNAYDEAFVVQPEIRCPVCGYTKDTAMLAGDHQNCRRFPFFPGEKGKSYAIG